MRWSGPGAIAFAAALALLWGGHADAEGPDLLAKALGAGFVELSGPDAPSFVVGNSLSGDDGHDTRFQIHPNEALFHGGRSNLCQRKPAQLTETGDCDRLKAPGEECRPYRVFAKRNIQADQAPPGARLGYFFTAGHDVPDWEIGTLLASKRKILKGDNAHCPALEFDRAARPLALSAADAAALADPPASTEERRKPPAGFDARLLIGNSVVKGPATDFGCTPSVTFFAPDGRIISATCSVWEKGGPTVITAEVIGQWRSLAAPLCPPGTAQHDCMAAKGVVRPANGEPRLCIENAEDEGNFSECDRFGLSLKPSAAATAVEVEYGEFNGFPGVIYQGDVMGLAKFPKLRR